MEIKRLGKTKFKVSRIGFGGVAIAGFHYGKTKDKESISAIKKALQLGVNFFDTADVYGFGKSEKLLSEGLGKKRNEVVIATKVGVRWDKKKEKSYYDLSPDYVYGALEKSISNLRVKSIPLYQLHMPDPKTPILKTMAVLNKLKKEGKIKHIGCSNFSASQIKKMQEYARVESVQIPYNILEQKAEKDIIPLCEKLNMGIIAYTPIAQGFLSGKYRNAKFSENDRRNKSAYFTPGFLKKAMPLLERMEIIGEKHNKTMVQVALRWILDNPSITCIIIGVKTKNEIEEAIGATGWNLLEKEREELKILGKKAWK